MTLKKHIGWMKEAGWHTYSVLKERHKADTQTQPWSGLSVQCAAGNRLPDCGVSFLEETKWDWKSKVGFSQVCWGERKDTPEKSDSVCEDLEWGESKAPLWKFQMQRKVEVLQLIFIPKPRSFH